MKPKRNSANEIHSEVYCRDSKADLGRQISDCKGKTI